MTIDKKIELIKMLIEEIEERIEYRNWFYSILHDTERCKADFGSIWQFRGNHATPNDAMIKDSARIIGRLGFSIAREINK